jgi:hypothetical protein
MTTDIAALQDLPEAEPIGILAEEGRPAMAALTRPHCNFITCIVTST